MSGPVRLLVTGDLHMGRTCASLPDAWAGARLTANDAWMRAVETAIAEDVEVLVLTGDVVDRDNRFFEAFGPLTTGLARLADAGIETVAVAGNHDFDVLTRLADQLPGERFHLLGRGGTWERWTYERDGRPAVVFEGWSFPRGRFDDSPLRSYDLPRLDGVEAAAPVVGVLHSERDVTGSPYAPTRLDELRARPTAAWLLGHVHAPELKPSPGAPVLYPGSPLALDFREQGAHGPWRVEVESSQSIRIEQLPTSRIRYADVDVDISGLSEWDDVRARMVEVLGDGLEAMSKEGAGSLEKLLARVCLVGRSAFTPDDKHREDLSALELPHEGALLRVHHLIDRTRTPADLQRLARLTNPAGALARRLLALEAGDVPRDLLGDALEALRRARNAGPYQGIRDSDAPDQDAARSVLLEAGYELLDRLVEQKGPESFGESFEGESAQSPETSLPEEAEPAPAAPSPAASPTPPSPQGSLFLEDEP